MTARQNLRHHYLNLMAHRVKVYQLEMALVLHALVQVHDVAPVQGQVAVQIHAVHVVKVYQLEMALVLHALVQVHDVAPVQGQAAVLIHAAYLVKAYQLVTAFPVEACIAAHFYAEALVSLVEMAFLVQAWNVFCGHAYLTGDFHHHPNGRVCHYPTGHAGCYPNDHAYHRSNHVEVDGYARPNVVIYHDVGDNGVNRHNRHRNNTHHR